jgi:hypothetical protein
MDFPVFLNKFIIGNKYLRHSSFWWWWRLMSHQGFRFDDYYVWKEFWMSLNQGYLDIEYRYEFENFWGKNAEPEITYISPEAYDKLLEMIESPPKPSQGLIDLMNRPSPFKNNE